MRKHGKDVRRPVIPFVVAALALASASVAYAESFEGSRGANRYVGTADPDRVELYAGDDTAFGRAGADKLFGGPDDDRLHGEDGRDTILGQAGSDILVGGPGEDHLFGASGNNTINTGTLPTNQRHFSFRERPGPRL